MTVNKEKKLAYLLQAAGLTCDGGLSHSITAVTSDSREVKPGSLFVALSGASHDGHDYIEEAVAKGCIAVLAEKDPLKRVDVPVIKAPDTRGALGYIAAAFYDFPAREAVLIGITGTNGKTTSAWLIEAILKKAGYAPGVFGTVSIRFQGEERHSKLTTPEPLELHKVLREMVDKGVSHIVMEVSSHALQQDRVNGLRFDVALFTNLSREHLDYHPDMNHYFAVKKRLFSRYLRADGTAVINLEDNVAGVEKNDKKGGGEVSDLQWGRKLTGFLENLKTCRIISCGLKEGEIHAVAPGCSLEGISAEIVTPAGNIHLESSLVGDFNLHNLVSAAGCGLALGISPESIGLALEEAESIPGRLERVPANRSSQEPVIFVDYAHTPDALEHVLVTLRPFVEGRLIVVFGCGGDRDRGKRALMGEVAGRLGDIVIVTSDNPRSESPAGILSDIEKGLVGLPITGISVDELRKIGFPAIRTIGAGLAGDRVHRQTYAQQTIYTVIQDRGKAIQEAIAVSRPEDVVAICGKGHESYQVGKFGPIFFDDRLEAIKALNRPNKTS